MKIESNGDEKITVALSVKDLDELDITYDEMDYSNIETRRVIWTILDEARRTLGKPINTDGKLLIEASPLDDGGCLLSFTAMPFCEAKGKKRLIMKKNSEPIVFCALDENAFLDALKVLSLHKNGIMKKEAYSLNGKYHLVIYPKTTFNAGIFHILSEFGDTFTPPKVEISRLYEHGVTLNCQ